MFPHRCCLVLAAVPQEGLGESDGHLRVIGELTRGPAKGPASNHFSDAADDGLWELREISAGGFELERGAECVARGRTQKSADGGLGLLVGEGMWLDCSGGYQRG